MEKVAKAILWVTVRILVALYIGCMSYAIYLLWQVEWIIGFALAVLALTFHALAMLEPQ